MPKNIIGLSLPLCIDAIARGVITEERIFCILADGPTETAEDWLALVKRNRTYWSEGIQLRANIALLLHAQGKIVPARHTEAGDVIIYNDNHGIWEVNGRQAHTKDLLVHI
jgi:hypothetical protein